MSSLILHCSFCGLHIVFAVNEATSLHPWTYEKRGGWYERMAWLWSMNFEVYMLFWHGRKNGWMHPKQQTLDMIIQLENIEYGRNPAILLRTYSHVHIRRYFYIKTSSLKFVKSLLKSTIWEFAHRNVYLRTLNTLHWDIEAWRGLRRLIVGPNCMPMLN